MADEKLTEEDIKSIKYFILRKGDITRWNSWEEKKHIVAEVYPELIQALNMFTIAERTLNIIAKHLGED